MTDPECCSHLREPRLLQVSRDIAGPASFYTVYWLKAACRPMGGGRGSRRQSRAGIPSTLQAICPVCDVAVAPGYAGGAETSGARCWCSTFGNALTMTAITVRKPSSCPNCGMLLAFEASHCGSCGRPVAFDPISGAFTFFDQDRRWLSADGRAARGICDNARYAVCNWTIPDDDGPSLCFACRHNRLIPDLSVAGVLARWRRIEDAKRRTIFALFRLGVPPLHRSANSEGLQFDFLYDPSAEVGDRPALLTGHEAGLVTINLIEADDVARERLRHDLGEPYRTLVGHFRHEIGHYYWHRLIEHSADLLPFRAVFGDERIDYSSALRRHYEGSPPVGWEDRFVSCYATAHPWEDFAETFAHYLHIVDTLTTIGSFGLTIDGFLLADDHNRVQVDFDPFTADTATLVSRWLPLAFAINSINRSMGQPDLYPFRISPQIVLKLDFVNRLMAFAAGRWAPGEKEAADLKAMAAALGHDVSAID